MEESETHDHDDDDIEGYEICIPPLLALEHVISIYCEEMYVLCGSNIKQTCMILEITEDQLIEFLSEELDFNI